MLRALKTLSIDGVNLRNLTINNVQSWAYEDEKTQYTNQVPLSIDTDGSIYNDCGYMDGYRLNSSAAVKETSGATHTGYIQGTANDVIRAKVGTAAVGDYPNYIATYSSDFTLIQCHTFTNAISYGYATYDLQDDERYLLTIDLSASSLVSEAAFVRISCGSCNGADLIVTVNEEIS